MMTPATGKGKSLVNGPGPSLLIALIVSLSWLDACVSPPRQPLCGPGGSDYRHEEVSTTIYGEGGTQYWLNLPATPTPAEAPLIVFGHGWAAMDPFSYQPWIDHIVKRGNIVVFPRYQADLATPSEEMTPNAFAAVKDAIERLQGEGPIEPDLERFAAVGHSMGGVISADMAALAATEGLPPLRAVMIMEPGASPSYPMADLSQVPADTLMLTVVGAEDDFAGEWWAKPIFAGMSGIPEDNRDYVTVRSDHHGRPKLRANHLAPVCMVPDALDFYGFWKLFDALSDAAFYGTHREYALGDTPEQRFMGIWSDGTPVCELSVTDDPGL